MYVRSIEEESARNPLRLCRNFGFTWVRNARTPSRERGCRVPENPPSGKHRPDPLPLVLELQ